MKFLLSAVAFFLVAGIGTMVYDSLSAFHQVLFPPDMGACELRRFHQEVVQGEPMMEVAFQKFWEHPSFSGECRFYRFIPEFLLPMVDYPIYVSFGQFCYHAIPSLYGVAYDRYGGKKFEECLVLLAILIFGVSMMGISMYQCTMKHEREYQEYLRQRENKRFLKDVKYLLYLANELFHGDLSLWEGITTYIMTEEDLQSAIPVFKEKMRVRTVAELCNKVLILDFFEKSDSEWSFKVLMGVFDMYRKSD